MGVFCLAKIALRKAEKPPAAWRNACAETNGDFAFVKINLTTTQITGKNSYIRRQKKISDAKRKTSVG